METQMVKDMKDQNFNHTVFWGVWGVELQVLV